MTVEQFANQFATTLAAAISADVTSIPTSTIAPAIAANIFILHLLGDVPSPTMMGYVADLHSLQAAFVLPVIAMVLSSAILFYGMKFAPQLQPRDPARNSAG